jgi:hypothetical protein
LYTLYKYTSAQIAAGESHVTHRCEEASHAKLQTRFS